MNDRTLHAIALGVTFVACLTADHASAYCRMTTEGGAQIGNSACVEKGEPLVWSNPCLSYAVDSRGSRWMDLADIETAVDASFKTWEEADCSGSPPNLIFKPSLVPSTCRRAEFNTTGNVNTIAFLDPWRDPCADADDPGYDAMALAVTIVWHNTTTGEILDADMMINDQQTTTRNAGGPYANCPDEGCLPPDFGGDADLASIVTHEAGHFIGIGHSDIAEATMFASAERDSVAKRTLAQDDINAVCAIYPPGNLDDTCTAVPMGGLQLNCETTASGDEILCDDPASVPTSSGGCSACTTAQFPGDSGVSLLLVLVGLTVLRRRSRHLDARS
jgi:MYXO-CTERM domain-containing protein